MKRLFLSLVLCLAFPFLAFAGDMEEDLQERYGEKLTSAPVALKLKYLQETGLSWEDAKYDTRLEMLEDWTIEEEEARAAKKIEDKALRLKERQEREEAKQVDLAERARKRAQREKERKEAQEKKEYDRQMRELQRQREETTRMLKQKQKARSR